MNSILLRDLANSSKGSTTICSVATLESKVHPIQTARRRPRSRWKNKRRSFPEVADTLNAFAGSFPSAWCFNRDAIFAVSFFLSEAAPA